MLVAFDYVKIMFVFHYYFDYLLQLRSALVFQAQGIPLRPGQNLDDGLITVTLAHVFYSWTPKKFFPINRVNQFILRRVTLFLTLSTFFNT